jgi:hypothetical protein
MAMRRLGVYGDNLPTKKERSVEPADFTIAGLYAKFERKYDRVYRFRNQQEALSVLGDQTNPADYGWDALNGFFANLQGQAGSIYVASYKGTGAVQASVDNIGGTGYLSAKAAYQGEPCYGTAANRIRIAFTRGSAFSTKISVAGTTSTTITVESTAGLRVGDMLQIGASAYHKVVSIDESAKTVVISAAMTTAVGDAVEVLAYQVHTYLKTVTGVENEVDAGLSKIWVTTNSLDPDRFIESVFKNSSYVDFTVGASLPASGIPVDTTAKLAGGTDGTSPSTQAAFKAIWPMFDTSPVRMVACPETAVTEIQQSLEEYCKSRSGDNPIVFLTGQMGMITKTAVVAAGQNFQRGNEVDAVFVHNWLAVPDPFASSPTAPKRQVPPVGHLMGQWIQSIGLNGIHASPARKDCPILGVSDVVGYSALNDFDRTDLAEAGVNVIQNVSGRGIIVRNHFTPSTSPEFRYSNAVIQRNYIKVSVVDSLQTSENTPNSITQVRADRMACLHFMNKMWDRGSTGNVPKGETFGQYEKADGSLSSQVEAYEVIADASNNSVATLQAGERNIDIYFMFPAPAGSIKVGVGIIYRVS